jgi:hypothetical protein
VRVSGGGGGGGMGLVDIWGTSVTEDEMDSVGLWDEVA